MLVLDEPVASLDPQSRRTFMGELLQQMQAPGKIVIFSTHITADLERADADIDLLRNGRIQFTRSLAELCEHLKQVVFTRAHGWSHAPIIAGRLKIQIQNEKAILLVEDPLVDSLQALAMRETASVRIETLSLENLFVELA